jgi:hypothetical protein
MGEKTERAYCRTCEAPVLATKQKPAHVLHLLLTLVTFGLWLFVWAFLTMIASMKSFRCPTCGDTTVAYTRSLRKEFEGRSKSREVRF